MGDKLHVAKGEELERKAEKKINSWSLLFSSSKYEDAAQLYSQSANHFKLAKSWDRAAAVFLKLPHCHLKLDSKHEAAGAYVDAALCYKKKTSSSKEAIWCLEQAVGIFSDMGRHHMAGKYSKEIGELYEQEQDAESAIRYFQRAADYFEYQDAISTANQCKQKVAEYSAQIGRYQAAIEIYEEIARQSLNNNLLKYGVRGHLLNASLCQLCRGDVVAITSALERYEDLDPTFSRTREYKFLSDLATAIDEEDAAKFTYIVKEFDSISKLLFVQTLVNLPESRPTENILAMQDSWKATLLLRVKDALKAKEQEEDDLT